MNKLEQAAELIENGWCVGQLRNGDGKYCSLGAILAVNGISEVELFREALEDGGDPYVVAEKFPETTALVEELHSRGIYTGMNGPDVIYCWNDEQEDVNDVLDVFKHAAKRIDKE